jgi:hypothetical protein
MLAFEREWEKTRNLSAFKPKSGPGIRASGNT